MRKLVSINFLFLILVGCNPNRHTPAIVELKPAPTFNEDSAYRFIEQQLAFGPRIPGTAGHDSCGNFIVNSLKQHGFTVSEQTDTIQVYAGKTLPLRNIQGSINPELGSRILLCAHWDSRHVSDQDSNNPDTPFDGANDNASGVAVLLEIARCMATQSPNLGIDIVFFDLEDQGRTASETYDDANDHGFCRGSFYWSERVDGSRYRYGILLDMVGAKDAVFTLEGTSFRAAPSVMYKVWDMADQLGFGRLFVPNRTSGIFDDHVHLIEAAGIPSIDIIQHDASSRTSFGTYWHTHEDELSLIDRGTLRAVGQSVLQVVYNESDAQLK